MISFLSSLSTRRLNWRKCYGRRASFMEPTRQAWTMRIAKTCPATQRAAGCRHCHLGRAGPAHGPRRSLRAGSPAAQNCRRRRQPGARRSAHRLITPGLNTAATPLFMSEIVEAPVSEISATALRCEYKYDPLGIDIPHPSFSWQCSGEARLHSERLSNCSGGERSGTGRGPFSLGHRQGGVRCVHPPRLRRCAAQRTPTVFLARAHLGRRRANCRAGVRPPAGKWA